MTFGLRFGFIRTDAGLISLGALVTLLGVVATTYLGDVFTLTMLVALATFTLVVSAFVSMPHIAIAAMIPLFVVLPALKVLVVPWIGPFKDVIALAAIGAAAVTVVQAARGGRKLPGDLWVVALTAFVIGLYVLNAGGDLARHWGWAHGVRLVSEPLLLLLAGMALPQPRRTLRWALASIVATACLVSVVGVFQQIVGGSALVDMGYQWDQHVRTIEGRLRSFGTLDEPFAYAAFLLFGFAAVLMWMRRGPLAYAAGTLIAVGLAFSLVRSSLVVAVGLFALWLARYGRHVTATFLLAIVFASTLFFVLSVEATEQRTVRSGPSTFLTINGRTEAWRIVFEDPWEAPLGKGVGVVGTAADRAEFKITRSREEAVKADTVIVDSGYFATVADVGLVGLVGLLLLVARVGTLARRRLERVRPEPWIALSFLLVLLLDAVTRESFTAFPTAYLGLLVVGIAVAAAQREDDAVPATPPRREGGPDTLPRLAPAGLAPRPRRGA